MEESLRSSEIYLKTIFNLVQTGLVIIDPETHVIVDVNPAAAGMIGTAREQIVGNTCHRFICPAEQGKCPVTDLAQTVDNSERVLLSAAGPRSIIKTVVPATLSGKPYLLESFVDITDRKKAEEALETSEAMYRMLAENSLDIISRHSLGLILNYVSPAARTLIGIDPETIIGKNLLEFVHPGDHEQIMTAAREILEGSNTTSLVIRLRTAAGDYRWFESISRAVKDENSGIITEIYNVSRDITSRKAAEENAHRRDRVLHGFATASGFLLTGRLKEPIPRVLATIGKAMGADVSYIYEETLVTPDGGHQAVRRHRWARETASSPHRTGTCGQEGHRFPEEWSHRLASGVWISGCLNRFSGEDRAVLEDLGIHSILLVPIFVREAYWGFIGVSDMSTDRVWADSEIEILMTLAATLGLVFERRPEVIG
jgi:PAS domain S-box-containing protein